jgi:hypothetical protein
MIQACSPFFRRVALALLVLAGLPSFIQAQPPPSPPTVIKVGDSSVDGSFLKPYKNAWKVVYAFPGKEPFLVGTWTDELAAVEVNGRHFLRRTQMADYAKYNIVTTYVNVLIQTPWRRSLWTSSEATQVNGRIAISTRRW